MHRASIPTAKTEIHLFIFRFGTSGGGDLGLVRSGFVARIRFLATIRFLSLGLLSVRFLAIRCFARHPLLEVCFHLGLGDGSVLISVGAG